MNYEIKIYEGDDAKTAADIALKNRLYVSGWSLSGALKAIRCGYYKAKIAMVYEQDKPVAVGIQTGQGSTEIFVRKSYRRKKIGSNIAQKLKHEYSYGLEGIEGSCIFWNKVGYPLG